MKQLIQSCVLVACCLAPLPVVWAGGEPSIKTGTYKGMWQGGRMKLTIEKVSRNTFTGLVHMDKESEWPSLKFDVKGEANQDGTITVHRVNDEWNQEVTAKAHGAGKQRHWKGILTGPGTSEKKHFELRMPD
jgi:hypothetical protein